MMTSARDISLEAISPGDVADISWTATTEEVNAFAELSGDHNPLHKDPAYARAKGFSDCVVHGFFLGAKISGLIGMILPGKRCLLLEESLAFPNPTYPGDTVSLKAEISEIRHELALVMLRIKVTKATDNGPQTVTRGTVTCKILS